MALGVGGASECGEGAPAQQHAPPARLRGPVRGCPLPLRTLKESAKCVISSPSGDDSRISPPTYATGEADWGAPAGSEPKCVSASETSASWSYPAAASTMRDGTYWDATNEESTSAVMCGRLRGGHGRG